MLLLPSSHLAIHLPSLSNGFSFYKSPFNDLIHQFYDLQETYITITQNVNSHTSQFTNCCFTLNSTGVIAFKVFQKNGLRAGGLEPLPSGTACREAQSTGPMLPKTSLGLRSTTAGPVQT